MAPKSLKTLMKIDRRKQWKTLKTKYKAEISQAKLDLDLKLGPGLDKYQVEVDKLARLAGTKDLVSGDLVSIRRATTPLFATVERYQARVKTMGGPAGKDLGAMLAALEAEFHGWDEMANALPSVTVQKATKEQAQAADGLITILQNVHGACGNVESRAPRSIIFFKKEGRAEAADRASSLLIKARAADADVLNLAQAAVKAAKGTNYHLVKTRAKTVAALLEQLGEAAEGYLTAVTGVSLTNLGTKALKAYAEDVVRLCDLTRKQIAALP